MNFIKELWESIAGKKINNTRIVPLTTKIILIFTIFILVSNLSSNYINMMFNRKELINSMKQLLVKDLKDLYNFCNTQFDIYQYNQDLKTALQNIENKAISDFKYKKSIGLGIKPDGTLLFEASGIKKYGTFTDTSTFDLIKKNKQNNVDSGIIPLVFNNESYFGVYKYNPKWDIYILKAEQLNEFYADSWRVFRDVSFIIVVMTLLFSVVGIFILQYITRFIGVITSAIIKMSRSQSMDLIELGNATNDEITFLGVAFNSLSSTVNNLLTIFRKFVNKDIANKAYREREVRLEGTQRNLTILFSDIKSFTYMTETLGTDIIKLLNIHYDRAIREIINLDGVIGSIIGDALLAVFGSLEESKDNKSHQSVLSAYKIQDVAESLRFEMHRRKEVIVKERGALSDEEDKVYKAVLLEVGVGIDGGDVFYGNIGSYERMTNTVIGDNVNSASRLEGLTRIYKVPVICSDFVKNDIEQNVKNHGFYFLELDIVQVKGKTEGKRIFWPIFEKNISEKMKIEIDSFSSGLQYYYQGDWKKAADILEGCSLPLADIFKERVNNNKCPKDWKGIWTMTTK